MICGLNAPRRLRSSSQMRLQPFFARSMIAFTSVISGKMGEIKQVVRTPASRKAFIAASLRSIDTALSMSFLKSSSNVLTDHETRASGKVLMSSRSRRMRSDFVAMEMFAPLPCSLFEDGAGTPVNCFAGLIRIGHRADKYLLSRILFGACDGLPILHVDKLAPGLQMPRKAFHKAGITIFAAVFAPDIRVERMIAHGQIRFGDDIFYLNFSYGHFHLPKRICLSRSGLFCPSRGSSGSAQPMPMNAGIPIGRRDL